MLLIELLKAMKPEVQKHLLQFSPWIENDNCFACLSLTKLIFYILAYLNTLIS